MAKLAAAALVVGTCPPNNVTGETRRLLYLSAFATGLRYGELRRLRVSHLRLHAKPPQIVMPPKLTKNRGKNQTAKGDVVLPIPAWLVAELRGHVAEKSPDAAIFDAPKQITKAMARDMEEAGLPRLTEEGHLDFHSLRHGFVTELARSGVDLKTLQKLARHSTAVLTLNIYTHLGELDARAKAVEAGVLDPTSRKEGK